MNKYFYIAAAALCAAATAQADVTTVKTLYAGEPVNVTWANTLKIEAADFAEGVNVGDYLSISLANATDVLE